MSTSTVRSIAVSSVVRRLPLLVIGSTVLVFAAACSTDGAGAASSDASPRLPAAIGARWTPPEFATRSVDGERAAVLEGCVTAANALGFSVNRVDGATGKISATRRQAGVFDGAREDMLAVTVTTLAPDVATVAVVLREAVESESFGDGAGGMVTTSLVRDRAPYDAFFARLAEALRPAEAPAAPAAPAS
jgi:hypothetical protein